MGPRGTGDMVNPFVHGSRVTGDAFFGRDEELAVVERELSWGVNVALYSYGRMGKTSLLHELARRKPKGLVFAFVDLRGLLSTKRFLEQLVSKSAEACLGPIDGFDKSEWALLRGTGLNIDISPDGGLAIDFAGVDPTWAETAEALDLPERLATSEEKSLILVFDEVQEVHAVCGKTFLKTMMSRFERHKNVTYAFSGSNWPLIRRVFEGPGGAFHKSGVVVNLGPMGIETLSEFVVRRFRSEGGSIPKDLARALVQRVDGHPYCTQLLAYELWNISKAPSRQADLEWAVARTIEHQSLTYLRIWESIKSPVHRRLLAALASEARPTMGTDFIRRHGLVSRSHVQRAEKTLVERGLVEKGRIVDPMFCMWLKSAPGR